MNIRQTYYKTIKNVKENYQIYCAKILGGAGIAGLTLAMTTVIAINHATQTNELYTQNNKIKLSLIDVHKPVLLPDTNTVKIKEDTKKPIKEILKKSTEYKNLKTTTHYEFIR